jgi:hypothetical protein
MEVRARLITDLEEEILFQLSMHETELPMLAIVERISGNTNIVSLARMHETLIQLEVDELITTVSSSRKRNYKITTVGLATLQTDWSHYARSVNKI